MKKGKHVYGSASLNLKRFEVAALITLLLLLVSPLFTSAQTVDELQAQIQALLARVAALQGQLVGTTTPPQPPPPGNSDDYPTPTVGPSCPNLSITMQRGARDTTTGGQVTELQIFLANHFDLDEEDVVSGYFGKLTQQFVTKFQNKYGLPAFGIAGSLTRAKIAEVCGGSTLPPPPPTCPVYSLPLCQPNEKLVGGGVGPNGCQLPPKCVPSQAKCGVNTFRVENQCGDGQFRNAYVQCYDGYEQTLGGDTSCKSSELWQEYARNACTNHCSGPIQASITVTTPNGGEQWEMGLLNTVTWTPYQYSPDINPSRDVTAYIETKSTDGVYRTYGKVEESGKASIHWVTGQLNSASQTYSFVPPGSGYYIRVVNNKTGAWDRSDAPFTVLPRPVDVKVNGLDGPMSLTQNQKVTVSWTSTGGRNNCTLAGVSETPGGNNYIPNQPGSGSRELYARVEGFASVITATCMLGSDYSTSVYDWVSVNPTAGAHLTITNPNGGEQIDPNKEMAVEWNYDGISTVSVALYKNDQWLRWLHKDGFPIQGQNRGSLTWMPSLAIPGLGTGDNAGAIFKIYVTGQKSDGTGYVDDKSDAPFSFVTAPLPSRISFFSVYYDNESTADNQTKVQFGTENMKQCDLYSYDQTSYGPNGEFYQGPARLYAQGIGVGGAFGTPESIYVLRNAAVPEAQLELRCVGSDGRVSSRIVWIHTKMSPTPVPAVTFSALPTSGTAPLTVQFTATNLDTASNTYVLNYGDGSQLAIGGCGNSAPCYNYHNGSHTYTAAGTYTATLMYQPPSAPCNAPPGAACLMVMPAPVQVGIATITVSGAGCGDRGCTSPVDPSTYPNHGAMGGTSASGTNVNLANALSALEATLDAIIRIFNTP